MILYGQRRSQSCVSVGVGEIFASFQKIIARHPKYIKKWAVECYSFGPSITLLGGINLCLIRPQHTTLMSNAGFTVPPLYVHVLSMATELVNIRCARRFIKNCYGYPACLHSCCIVFECLIITWNDLVWETKSAEQSHGREAWLAQSQGTPCWVCVRLVLPPGHGTRVILYSSQDLSLAVD